MNHLKVKLLENIPGGLAKNDKGEFIECASFVGKVGELVITGMQGLPEKPTGFEPCYFLIDFDGVKLWLPDSMYFGDDGNGNEIWRFYLKEVK